MTVATRTGGRRQLDLPLPPRARLVTLAAMIEQVLMGHYDVHRSQIAAKLRTATTHSA